MLKRGFSLILIFPYQVRIVDKNTRKYGSEKTLILACFKQCCVTGTPKGDQPKRSLHVVNTPQKFQHWPYFTGLLVFIYSSNIAVEPVHAHGSIPSK